MLATLDQPFLPVDLPSYADPEEGVGRLPASTYRRRRLVAALLLVSVVVGLGVTMGLVYFLAKEAGLTVNGQSQAILSILAIGGGLLVWALVLLVVWLAFLR